MKLRVVRAELQKLHRSWSMLSAVLGPIAMVGILFVIFRFSEDLVQPGETGFHSWYQIAFAAWDWGVMPVVVTLMAVLAWESEAAAGSWKHLMALPIGRGDHFVGRLMGQCVLLVGAHLLLAVTLIAGGVMLRSGVPHLAMGATQLPLLGRHLGWALVAGQAMIVFHGWLCSRLSGVGPNLVVLLLGGALAFRLTFLPMLASLLPWGLTLQIPKLIQEGREVWPLGLASVVGALLFLALGMMDWMHRDEPRGGEGA